MNQLMSLFKTFESENSYLATGYSADFLNDLKMLIVTEAYMSAANHIRTYTQKITEEHNLDGTNVCVQLLGMIHNLVLDKEKEQLNDYFDSLFGLIFSNDDVKELVSYNDIRQCGHRLESKEHYDQFVSIGQFLNKQDFKNKELIVLFFAKILQTHDKLKFLRNQYL